MAVVGSLMKDPLGINASPSSEPIDIAKSRAVGVKANDPTATAPTVDTDPAGPMNYTVEENPVVVKSRSERQFSSSAARNRREYLDKVTREAQAKKALKEARDAETRKELEKTDSNVTKGEIRRNNIKKSMDEKIADLNAKEQAFNKKLNTSINNKVAQTKEAVLEGAEYTAYTLDTTVRKAANDIVDSAKSQAVDMLKSMVVMPEILLYPQLVGIAALGGNPTYNNFYCLKEMMKHDYRRIVEWMIKEFDISLTSGSSAYYFSNCPKLFMATETSIYILEKRRKLLGEKWYKSNRYREVKNIIIYCRKNFNAKLIEKLMKDDTTELLTIDVKEPEPIDTSVTEIVLTAEILAVKPFDYEITDNTGGLNKVDASQSPIYIPNGADVINSDIIINNVEDDAAILAEAYDITDNIERDIAYLKQELDAVKSNAKKAKITAGTIEGDTDQTDIGIYFATIAEDCSILTTQLVEKAESGTVAVKSAVAIMKACSATTVVCIEVIEDIASDTNRDETTQHASAALDTATSAIETVKNISEITTDKKSLYIATLVKEYAATLNDFVTGTESEYSDIPDSDEEEDNEEEIDQSATYADDVLADISASVVANKTILDANKTYILSISITSGSGNYSFVFMIRDYDPNQDSFEKMLAEKPTTPMVPGGYGENGCLEFGKRFKITNYEVNIMFPERKNKGGLWYETWPVSVEHEKLFKTFLDAEPKPRNENKLEHALITKRLKQNVVLYPNPISKILSNAVGSLIKAFKIDKLVDLIQNPEQLMYMYIKDLKKKKLL